MEKNSNPPPVRFCGAFFLPRTKGVKGGEQGGREVNREYRRE